MQEPTDQAETFIPTETTIRDSSDENLNRTVAVRRKAAKRTLPWDLAAGELDLVSPPPPQPPQAEEIPAKKKRRLEDSLSASTAPIDEAARKTASPDVSVGLPAAANNADNWTIGHWTPKEDAKLKSAVTNTRKKKWGSEYKTDWAAVAALVPGRTRIQCRSRWHDALNPSITLAAGRSGAWTAFEDSMLKDAVQTHYYNGWVAISALVPGRTRIQCRHRWHDVLDPNIDRLNRRSGKWAEDEDSMLKDAVQTFGGNNWGAIAALVPGRTGKQCHNRWRSVLDPSIGGANGRTGKWAEDEASKLREAVQTHGGNNWDAIAQLVPGRTDIQCRSI
jgi:hypothetical protein